MRKFFLLSLTAVMLTLQVCAQRTVTGRVTDDMGSPIPNVSVLVKGSNLGTVTADDGTYSIAVPANGRTLVFSSVDMGTKEVTIGTQTSINTTLQTADKSLQEVVVIGYGTQRRKEITGNIASVGGKEIADKPIQSFEQALGGRAAGVQITNPNGALNNPPVIRIRGTNSISLSSYPLIVVDGVPAFTGDASGTAAASNALASINPSDIESIDIAKDAAASAIYGSRAANGVVFITTKKGKQGKARINYDGWVGWTKVQRLPELLNAQQYTDLKNEGLKNAGTYNNDPADAITDNYFATSLDANGNLIDTRWYDYTYRTGISHSHNVNISGANDATRYYFSFGYTDQQGIVRKNNFARKSVLANIDQKINNLFSIGGKMAYSNQNNLAAVSSGSLPGETFGSYGLGRSAILQSPNVGPYKNDGSYNVGAGGNLGVMNNKVGSVGFANAIPSLDLNRQNSEASHLTGNVYLQLKPLSWITLRTLYGIDYLMVDNESFFSPLTAESFNIGSATSTYNKNKRSIWTNTAQFDYTFADKHNTSLLVGNEQQRTNGVGFGVNRTTLSDPFFTNVQGGFGTVAASGLSIGENYLYSEFGRVQYNFNKKYFITGNIRRDGASQLGTNQKYGTFWGASAGWEIAEENFWTAAGLDRVFSSFRLRGSYGKVGNIAGLGNFGALSTYGAGLYGTGATLTFNNAGNADLTWETSKKTDVGFSFGIMNERISGDLAFYKNDIDGLILDVPQPPSAGLPNAISTNVGTMYNKGIELSLNAQVVQKKDFTWSSSFNVSFNKNEVTSLAPGLDQITSATSLETVSITKPGYPVGTLFVTSTGGVDPATGRRIFINKKGQPVYFQFVAPAGQFRYAFADGTAAPTVSAADAVIVGMQTNPKYVGGFDNTFRFKGFELNALITYQFGNYVYYGSNAGLRDQRFWNNSTDVLRRWQKPGDVTDIPRLVASDNISNGSSFPLDINIFKGDFVKLRTLTFGYNVPKSFVDKAKLNSARFYVSGNNLAIITNYPGPDPEVSSNGNGTANQGVDRNQVANGRVITVGINIGF